ncbi:MAG: hypothetical protein VW516_11965 [Rhodospirillaceae bacterium]|jgi:hypothetical protein
MTAQQRDLHVLAARMCLDDVEGGDHPRRGFVVVYVRRGQGGDDDQIEIAACFGVQPRDLDELREGNDGWFGLESLLPAGEILEVLCRVVNDGAGYDSCTWLEIVKLANGSPAIEVCA